METTTEYAKSAMNTVLDSTVRDPNDTSNGTTTEKAYDTTKDTANQATDAASSAYDTASDYVPDASSDKTTTASLLNSAPFSSFKPDPSTVWKGHLIYVFLAAGCTLPWWTFLCAVDYFQFLYPGLHMIRLFPFVYYGPWLIVYALVVSFWRGGSSWVKINLGLSISVAAIAVIPLLEIFIGDKGTSATFWVTLVAVAIAGCADAIAQGSLLGVSSELPVSFTKAYCDGATASGVFMFIVRVITKASLSSSAKGLRIGAIVYFSVGALFLILVLALFAYVHYMPEMGYYSSLGLGNFETVRILIQSEDTVTIEVASGAAIAAVAAGRSSPAQPLNWGPIWTNVNILIIAMFMTSCITLSIFPGFLAENVPNWSGLDNYSGLLLLGTYIIFDFLGRLITASDMTERHSTVFGTAWLRLFLVGLFTLALLFDTGIILMLLLTAILGVSNGYLIVTLTVLVPKDNPSGLAETAGIVNALAMNLGVVVGAGLSWIWIVA